MPYQLFAHNDRTWSLADVTGKVQREANLTTLKAAGIPRRDKEQICDFHGLEPEEAIEEEYDLEEWRLRFLNAICEESIPINPANKDALRLEAFHEAKEAFEGKCRGSGGAPQGSLGSLLALLSGQGETTT